MLAELARLWDQARVHGTGRGIAVDQKSLARTSGVPYTTVNGWATGRAVPRDLDRLTMVGKTLADWANEQRPTASDWDRLLEADRASTRRTPMRQGHAIPVVGRPLAQVVDAFSLEVHRAISAPSNAEIPVLPTYVQREHDAVLEQVALAAAGGTSRIAVLVGGSSTGKTRACWEALDILRACSESWTLWHPIDPTRPDAALADLSHVGPRTVVWLNEAQCYLDGRDGIGERVAAGLRELLRDPARRPVLVLATLWPEHWNLLTAPKAGASRDDPHEQARELLAGHKIHLPTEFTASDLYRLGKAGTTDPRLAEALGNAADAQITQYLAGVPVLLDRYQEAPPAAAATIEAAIDARRLGCGPHIPLSLLKAAVPGYLTDSQWNLLDDEWADDALAYCTRPCNGVPGPLTRIRPRTTTALDGAHCYRLADYLEQIGRSQRRYAMPPDEFWTAAALLDDPTLLIPLGYTAYDRGFLRHAAQIWKRALSLGDPTAAALTVERFSGFAGQGSVPWVVSSISLDEPNAVATLLGVLREANAEDQVQALLTNDPAAHSAVTTAAGAMRLLQSLQDVNADEQAQILRDRLAQLLPLDDPQAIADLMDGLRHTGSGESIKTLLRRNPAAHAAITDADTIGQLLVTLKNSNAHEQISVLTQRLTSHYTHPGELAHLLDMLTDAGEDTRVRELLEGEPMATVPIEDAQGVSRLIGSLNATCAQDQLAALLNRDPATHVSLNNLYGLGELLSCFANIQAEDQIAKLLSRDPGKTAPVHGIYGPEIMHFLTALSEIGAYDQILALADHIAEDIPIDDPDDAGVALILLESIGAWVQIEILLERDPASNASLEDHEGVIMLLDGLLTVGDSDQIDVLTKRFAEAAPLDDCEYVLDLVPGLQMVGAEEQIMVWLAREPAVHAELKDFGGVVTLLTVFQDVGADNQIHILLNRLLSWEMPIDADWETVTHFVEVIDEIGAADQAKEIIDKLPAAGLFDAFVDYRTNGSRFRFGREPNGEPTHPWDWNGLT